jgi:hypothetical protein
VYLFAPNFSLITKKENAFNALKQNARPANLITQLFVELVKMLSFIRTNVTKHAPMEPTQMELCARNALKAAPNARKTNAKVALMD